MITSSSHITTKKKFFEIELTFKHRMIQIYVFILSPTKQALTSERKQILLILCIYINPFIPNAPFLYPLKISENRKVYFQGVDKEYIGNEWVNEDYIGSLKKLYFPYLK